MLIASYDRLYLFVYHECWAFAPRLKLDLTAVSFATESLYHIMYIVSFLSS